MEEHNDLKERFVGITRLYGEDGFQRLQSAHVCVVGLGGVGSWAVEALARTGVGNLTLIDLDDVCVTNVNRQLHALDGNIGRAKAEVLAERVKLINPNIQVQIRVEFFTASNAESIFSTRFSYVLDAIDGVSNKCALIAACVERDIPVITSGGAAARRESYGLAIEDLVDCHHDRLLAQVRKFLRKRHGFPRGEKKFGVEAVYLPQPVFLPEEIQKTCKVAENGESDDDGEEQSHCDSGLGSALFVTGAFGFAAAGRIVQNIAVGTSDK
ncbi:MAG: tRNA threonylcarbamoyladenosine dehydratase [Verrucomicrobiales bacterium]